MFLFDEPLSNLDAELRVQMRVEIARLHKELGATMIYVTHDQIEAMTLADRIVVLRAGNIEQIGAPLELYDDPANQFVAGFIGSPKMNFLAAEVVDGESGQRRRSSLPAMTALGCASRFPDSHRRSAAVIVLGIRPEHFGDAGSGRCDICGHRRRRRALGRYELHLCQRSDRRTARSSSAGIAAAGQAATS